MKKLWLFCVTIAILVPLRADENSATTVSSSTASSQAQYLNWEHSLVTRSTKSPRAVAKLKIYNNWTATRHRLMVKYNVLGLGAQNSQISQRLGPAFSMPDFDPKRFRSKNATYHHGTVGLIQRLDDDRLVGYSSEAETYFSQPRRALMKRLRFDPWKKLAPELSKENPPTLTLEQRRRLGHEVRALTQPLLKDVFKSYFRALPAPRTFTVHGEKIEARGYRLAMLFNAGNSYEGAQWFHIHFEWWLAPTAPGDEVLGAFDARYLSDLRAMHGPTTSMWLNEALPILWQTMPATLHQAVATLLPNGFSADLSTLSGPGSLVYAGMTLKPPKSEEKTSDTGTLRVELQLTNRDTRVLDKSVFEAPPEYKKDSLEPVLKEWDAGIEAIQSLYDEDLRLSDASNANTKPKYSFNALKSYLRAVNNASH